MFRSTLLLASLCACTGGGSDRPPSPSATSWDRVERGDFNRVVIELGHPLFWSADEDGPGALDPSELEVWWGPQDVPLDRYVSDGRFTAEMTALYESVVTSISAGPTDEGLDAAEATRRALVRQELAYGRSTAIFTDLAELPAPEREMVGHLLAAARTIEHLHALQLGTDGISGHLDPADPASAMLLFRNQAPWCESPGLASDPACSALPTPRDHAFGLYPADLQQDETFCDALQEAGGELLDPFTAVVRDEGGVLQAQPFHLRWPAETATAASQLRAAAAALADHESEQPLRAYLLAAAQAFGDDDWFTADTAWVAMNATNSRWYLRVGPDEVYYEPCSRKAGFALRLALIDQRSLDWQRKLEPVKVDMERALADLAGPPYIPREVAFALPDFVGIVLNAGDARAPHGATIGQSLPNWGPVAEAGGRTIAMTNLFTDPDSRDAKERRAASIYCPATAASADANDAEPLLVSTVLHEAAHNLGPAAGHRVDGRNDEAAFGGALAGVYEELKAQTAALWLTDWLAGRDLLEADFARRAHQADLTWALGKLTEPLYSASGSHRAYSQLSAIQVGWFLEQGAMTWHPHTAAANGTDSGCLEVDHARLPAAIDALAREVLTIKSTADKARAEALRSRFVDEDATVKEIRELAAERWARTGQTSFVHVIRR